MFSDTIAKLNKVRDGALAMERVIRDHPNALYRRAERILRTKLVDAGYNAMRKIKEYNNVSAGAALLRQHLLENLSRPEHILIDDNGMAISLFNEEIAGTYDDLISGQKAAYSTDKPLGQRAAYWKYGIYKPAAEGYMHPAFGKKESLPDYTQVIIERLTQWGDKAPYWVLIEYGNAGGGYTYPSFEGTFFISDFRVEAERNLQMLRDAIAEALGELTRDQMMGIMEDPFASIPVIPPTPEVTWTRAVRKSTGEVYWQERSVETGYLTGRSSRYNPLDPWSD